jgi:hypothetical protein
MNALPCKHLRMKRIFMSVAANPSALATERKDICQCWCNQTMTEVGRDDRHVTRAHCTDPDRPCYRPV